MLSVAFVCSDVVSSIVVVVVVDCVIAFVASSPEKFVQKKN